MTTGRTEGQLYSAFAEWKSAVRSMRQFDVRVSGGGECSGPTWEWEGRRTAAARVGRPRSTRCRLFPGRAGQGSASRGVEPVRGCSAPTPFTTRSRPWSHPPTCRPRSRSSCSGSPPSNSTAVPGPKVGDEAKGFEVTALGGRAHEPSDLVTGRPVVRVILRWSCDDRCPRWTTQVGGTCRAWRATPGGPAHGWRSSPPVRPGSGGSSAGVRQRGLLTRTSSRAGSPPTPPAPRRTGCNGMRRGRRRPRSPRCRPRPQGDVRHGDRRPQGQVVAAAAAKTEAEAAQ